MRHSCAYPPFRIPICLSFLPLAIQTATLGSLAAPVAARQPLPSSWNLKAHAPQWRTRVTPPFHLHECGAFKRVLSSPKRTVIRLMAICSQRVVCRFHPPLSSSPTPLVFLPRCSLRMPKAAAVAAEMPRALAVAAAVLQHGHGLPWGLQSLRNFASRGSRQLRRHGLQPRRPNSHGHADDEASVRLLSPGTEATRIAAPQIHPRDFPSSFLVAVSRQLIVESIQKPINDLPESAI